MCACTPPRRSLRSTAFDDRCQLIADTIVLDRGHTHEVLRPGAADRVSRQRGRCHLVDRLHPIAAADHLAQLGHYRLDGKQHHGFNVSKASPRQGRLCWLHNRQQVMSEQTLSRATWFSRTGGARVKPQSTRRVKPFRNHPDGPAHCDVCSGLAFVSSGLAFISQHGMKPPGPH